METVRIWNVRDETTGLDPYILILDKKIAPGRSAQIAKEQYNKVEVLLKKIPGLFIGPVLPRQYLAKRGLLKAKIPGHHTRSHGPSVLKSDRVEEPKSTIISEDSFLID